MKHARYEKHHRYELEAKPWTPAQWEVMLVERQITESRALAILALPEGTDLRKWIMGHVNKSFVPVRFLKAMNLWRPEV